MMYKTKDGHNRYERFDPCNDCIVRTKSRFENKHALDSIRKRLWDDDQDTKSQCEPKSDSMAIGAGKGQLASFAGDDGHLAESLVPHGAENIAEKESTNGCNRMSLKRPYHLARIRKRKLYYP
mmetsp:Transcript_6175/g.9276  ORF Transcript_6175/g.9276 Transcript_6175/m.9276 type:complete len:123 (+) Transcript_6175:98-466(+)